MRISPSKIHGFGVFTERSYKKGDFLFTCITVPIKKREIKHINSTTLKDYYFDWFGEYFMALGNASMINHSKRGNVDWEYSMKDRAITFFASKKIRENTELLFDYGRKP